MHQTFRAFLALLGVAMVAHAEEPQAVKILARGPWPHLPAHTSAGIGTDRDHRLRALRSEAELLKAAGPNGPPAVAKALKVGAVDFKTHMLIVVEDGTQPMVGVSGGGPPSALYAVEVFRVDLNDAAKAMTVHWRLVPRGKDHGVLTRPLEAVLVARFDGDVTFNKLTPADKPGPEPAAAGKVATPAARAFWPDGWRPEAPRQEWVVRDYAALVDPRLAAPEPVLERMRADALARYAKALGVDTVDFAKHMVIGVSGGVQPAGARVEVTRVERDPAKKTLTVTWQLRPRNKGAPFEGVAHVAQIVLVDTSGDAVRFLDVTPKED